MGGSVEQASKGFMSSALLVAAVAAIVLAGLVLRTDRSETHDTPAIAAAPPLGTAIAAPPAPALAPADPPPSESGVEPEPDPAASGDMALARLAKRAETDAARLSGTSQPWTAQLLVACKPETVERLLAASEGSPRFYVLPARVHESSCFRVCFGAYASAKDAAAAADLPPALRPTERIGAVEIVRVLP